MAVLKCESCKPHEFQDEKYGKFKRVYTGENPTGNKQRCTVCDKEIDNPLKKK